MEDLEDKASFPSICEVTASNQPETTNVSPVKAMLSVSVKSTVQANKQPRIWSPRLLRFGPLSGIFCMLLAVGSVVASLGILAGSNNQPVANWSVPPSTYLAIFTAIANLSMRYAAIQGVIVAWWIQALKGSTITQLHWKWHAGTSLRGALAAGRNSTKSSSCYSLSIYASVVLNIFGSLPSICLPLKTRGVYQLICASYLLVSLVGIACIFSIIVAVDGPLLQRASTSNLSGEIINSIPLNVRMAPLIPHGYTGSWSTSKELNDPQLPVPIFNKTIQIPHGITAPNDIWPNVKIRLLVDVIGAWMKSSPLPGVVQGCHKSCRAKLKAPALFATCETRQIPFNPREEIADVNKVFDLKQAASIGHFAFITWPIFTAKQNEVIELISAHAHTTDCKGTINYTECSTKSGIGEYDVLIESDEIIMGSITTPRLVALANNTITNSTVYSGLTPGHLSTLGGIANILELRLASTLSYVPVNGTMNQMPIGTYPLTYVEDRDEVCLSFANPLPDFLNAINTLMLYVGAYAAQENRTFLATRMEESLLNEVNTTTVAFEYKQHYVFNTNYRFFVAAALVEVLCVILIVPTYWGWWKLGRPLSFSPLEMAKAFQSPLFSDFNSNSSAGDIARIADEKSGIKYGVLPGEAEGGHGGTKLAFADFNSVTKPRSGMMFPE